MNLISFIVLNSYYCFFNQTLYTKAIVSFLLSITALFICLINNINFFNFNFFNFNPENNGYYISEFNDFFINYIKYDIMNHILISYQNNLQIRTDLIIHHFIILIPFTLKPNAIGLTYSIISELYSAGSLFNLSPRFNLIYRAFIIIFVRIFLWTTLFLSAFNKEQSLIAIYCEMIISPILLLLDLYWLNIILYKLKLKINLNLHLFLLECFYG